MNIIGKLFYKLNQYNAILHQLQHFFFIMSPVSLLAVVIGITYNKIALYARFHNRTISVS